MDDSPTPIFSPGWINFFMATGAILLASLIALALAVIFGKKRKKKRHRRYRHSSNPTLAQAGGLPPVRSEKNPPPQS